MTIDIKQDDMNILNLNGISVDDVRQNIELQRATGVSDDNIRTQLYSTIQELRPITKTSPIDTGNIKTWNEQGPITPFEELKRHQDLYKEIGNYASPAYFTPISELRKKQADELNQKNNGNVANNVLNNIQNYNIKIKDNNNILDNLVEKYYENKTKNLNENDNNKKIGFWESLGVSVSQGEELPFVGGFIKGSFDKAERHINEKIQNNEALTPAQAKFIEYRDAQRQEEKVRGYSTLGLIGKDFAPSVLRFGTEIATGGWILKGLGLTKLSGQAGAGAYNALRGINASKKAALTGGKIVRGITNAAEYGAIGELTSADYTFENYQNRMLNNEMTITDSGEKLLQESIEKPGTAFLKSMGQTFVMGASEATGEILGLGIKGVGGAVQKYIQTPITKYLYKNKAFTDFIDKTLPLMSKVYEKMNKLPVKGKTYEWLKSKVKFDGFIEEMGEEVVEDILNLTLGTNGEERSLENYAKAIFKSPDEWAVIAGAVALQGGVLSASSQILGHFMERNGASDDEIINFMQNTPEEQKQEMVDQLVDEGLLNIDNFTRVQSQDISEEQAEYEAKVEAKILDSKAPMTKDQAVGISKLHGQFFNKYGKDEASKEVLKNNLDNLTIRYNVPVEDVDKINTYQEKSLYQDVKTAGANENETEEAKKEWEEKETESKYFKKWFGNSKVVDENGKPLVVYHGTNSTVFEEFNIDYPRYAAGNFKGAYFVDNIPEAKDYGNNIIPVYVKIENPLIGFPYEEYAKAKGIDYIKNRFTIKKAEVENWIEEMGFDGIIRPKGTQYNLNGMEIIAFNPEQIKSVNNHGTFDSNNPNIYFQPDNISNDNQENDIESTLQNLGYNDSVYFENKIEKISRTNKNFIENYKSLAERIYNDKATKKEKNSKIKLGTTPNKIVEAGAKKYKLEIEPSTISKMKNKHKLDIDQIKLIPELLHNPIAVFDTLSKNKESLVVLIDMLDKDNKPVIVPIQLNKNKSTNTKYTYLINEINSAYGRNEFQNFLIASIKKAKKIDKIKLKSFLKNLEKVGGFNQRTFSEELQLPNEGNSNNNIPLIQQNLNPTVKKNKTLFQPAYHGTPHKFDKFSLEHIGSGEGAQAHGWGLYFAGNKDISEGYMNSLSNTKWTYKGKQLKNNEISYFEDLLKNGKKNRIDYLKSSIERCEREIKKAEEYKKEVGIMPYRIEFDYKENKNYLKYFKEQIKIVKGIDLSKFKKETDGQLFKVDIPENDVLLDEDKLLSEQNENIQNLIQKVAKQIYQDRVDFDTDIINSREFKLIENVKDGKFGGNNFDYMGKDFYKSLAKILGSQKNASQYLNDFGIKGITYDGQQDGRCYVIFDDNAINILNTFYQEDNVDNPLSEPDVQKRMLGGYTIFDMKDKLEELYTQLGDTNLSDEDVKKINAKIHILENSIEYLVNGKINNQTPYDLAVNLVYTMNDEELPSTYIEKEFARPRSYRELKEFHEEKKAKLEEKYRGYFTDKGDDSIIVLMKKQNVSTLPHEFGHYFLKTLNDLAKVNEEARKDLEAVNKQLGASDNGEYTVAQQEKFASSFEAYLYKGKAPNARLRSVFESFKKWLRDVYDYISSIPYADISDDMQEIFDRMFADDGYYEEKKQANEILKNAKNINKKRQEKREKEKLKGLKIDDDKLTDYQKRYKETAYSILEVATGKDEKYLKSILETNSQSSGVVKKREALRDIIGDIADEIYVNGNNPEWNEFFPYKEGNDAEYVMSAYNAILNKEYLNADKYSQYEEEYAKFMHDTVDDADREYRYLIREYKNGNRNAALSAIYEWVDGLNSEIKEDYESRFIYDSMQIDRNENQDKFEKAKQKIIERAIQVDNKYGIKTDEGYKKFVQETMRSLTFLSAEDKARMTVNVLDVNGLDNLMYMVNNIMDVAKTIDEVNYRNKLALEISRELRETKNVKKGARTVGKYDYRTNMFFKKLRELDKLTPEKAQEALEISTKIAQGEENGLSYIDKLSNKFLSYKANGKTYADVELMKDIYDEIAKIKLAGKKAKDEQDLIEKLTEEKEVNRLIKILKNKKEGKFAIRSYIGTMGNLESIINAIWNKSVKDEYATEVLYAETQAETFQYEQKQKFENEVAKIYNLPKWNWDSKILDYLSQKNTYQENRREYEQNKDGEYVIVKQMTVPKELTKMDLILAYIWDQNSILHKRLVNQFGEAQLEQMFEELDINDVKLAELMMRTAQSTYPLVNRAFIKKFGLPLPKVECYFPSTVERGSELDLYNEYSTKSLNNSFTKERINTDIVPMQFGNPVQILYNHIDGVAKFAYMGESIDRMNRIFKNKTFLKPMIENKYGENVYKTLEQALLNVTYKAEAQVYNDFAKIFNTLSSNWIQANVAVKPLVALKQLISANNYAVDMPVMEWTGAFVKGVLDYKKTIDYMWKIPYIRARYGGSYSNEFLKQTIENSKFAKSKHLKDFLSMNVKLGDIGAIIFGGKPYIDYLIKQGKTEQEAIKQFILSTNRSQQSAAISSLSNFQIWASRQPLARVFTAYRNSQQQYARMIGDSIVSYANGDITKKQCAKIIYHYMFLQPFMFAVAGSGSLMTWALTGDLDDFISDFKLSLFNLASDAIPLFYDIYSYVIKKMVLGQKYIPQSTPLWGDITKELNKISKEDVSFGDYMSFLGYIAGNVSTGVPLKTIGSMGKGVVDMVSDDFLKGLFELIGYSESRAKRMTGQD